MDIDNLEQIKEEYQKIQAEAMALMNVAKNLDPTDPDYRNEQTKLFAQYLKLKDKMNQLKNNEPQS